MARLRPLDAQVSAEDRRWQAKADALRDTALSRTQASARGWMGALASVAGLVVFLTVLKGPDETSDLQAWCRIAVGALLLVSVAGLAGAIVLAARAADGDLRRLVTRGEELRANERLELASAGRRLACSRRLAVASLVVFVAPLGLAWYGPRIGHHLLVTRQDGSTVCVPQTGYTLELTAITKVAAVSDCPSDRR